MDNEDRKFDTTQEGTLTVTITLAEYRALLTTEIAHAGLRSELWEKRVKIDTLEKKVADAETEYNHLADVMSRREKLLLLQANLVFDERANIYVEPQLKTSPAIIRRDPAGMEAEE